MEVKLLKNLFTSFMSLIVFSSISFGEEGFWTFSDFKKNVNSKTHDLKLSSDSLHNIQNSLVKLTPSCVGSFISSDGLIITTRDCLIHCLENLPKKNQDIKKYGFYSKTIKDELNCPNFSALHLVDINDVTALINEEMKKKSMNDSMRSMEESAQIILKKCSEESLDTNCEISSYKNHTVHILHKYKKIDTIKLVFLAEESVSNFGDITDYFDFPQYSFNTALIRAYSKNDPYLNKSFIKWSHSGPIDNEWVLTPGFPVPTHRNASTIELKFLHEKKIPEEIESLTELRGFLKKIENQNDREQEVINLQLLRLEKTYSTLKSQRELIQSKKFKSHKKEVENDIQKKINNSSQLKKEYGTLWIDLEKNFEDLKKIYTPLNKFEISNLGSRLYLIAKILIHSSNYSSDEQSLIRESFIQKMNFNEEIEIQMIGFSLDRLKKELGSSHPTVSKILSGKNPFKLAKELVEKTQLKNIYTREKLLNGDLKSIIESKDPMIQLALTFENEAQIYRSEYSEQIEPQLKKNQEKLNQLYSLFIEPNQYPEPDFSPRVSLGQIKGFKAPHHEVSSFSILKGMFDLFSKEGTNFVTEKWLKKKDLLDLNSPMNFLISNDMNEGFIGSPVINNGGEFIGIILKGNFYAQSSLLGYNLNQSRSIVLNSQTLLEILKKVYMDERINQEIKRSAID